jgi:hypothetical protein
MNLSRTCVLAAAAVVVASGVGYASAAAPGGTTAAHAAPPSFRLSGAKGSTAVHAAPAAPQTADQLFVPLPSCRLVDTVGHRGPIAAGAARTFYVAGATGFGAQGGKNGGCGIPANATAVSAQFTAVDPAGAGSLDVYPAQQKAADPLLYFGAGQDAATGATQPIAPSGGLGLTVKAVSSATDLIIDVDGYYEPQIEAFVESNGTVYSSTSRVLSAAHDGTGLYTVTADTDVYDCSVTVTSSNSAVIANGYGSSGDQIGVMTYAWNASADSYEPADANFNVTATC